MSGIEDFVFPGVLNPLADADAFALHLAGMDSVQVARDTLDIFPDDTNTQDPEGDVSRREQLPQFGPPFVKYVEHRFDTLERKLAEKAMKQWAYEPTTWVYIASFQSDANGNVARSGQPNCVFAEPNAGFACAIHRVTILVDGFNFGTPFNVAAGYWELRVNDEARDGGSLVSGAGSFPVVKTWGTRDAIHVRDGELASIFISGTATFANKRITVSAQGTLERDPSA